MRRQNTSLAEHLYDEFYSGNTIGWDREHVEVRERWKRVARAAREVVRFENTPAAKGDA